MKIKFKTKALENYYLMIDYENEDYMLINRTSKTVYDELKNFIPTLYTTIQNYSYIEMCEYNQNEIELLKDGMKQENENRDEDFEIIAKFFNEIEDDYSY